MEKNSHLTEGLLETVENINRAEDPYITPKMQDIINKYPNGSYWNSEFDGGYQCAGFARLVYFEFFGKYQTQAEYYWATNNPSNAKLNNSLVFTEINAARIINALPIGIYMRVLTSNGIIHSLIIAAKNETMVTVYECNYVADHVSVTPMTYSTFINRYKRLLYFCNGTVYDSSLDGKTYTGNSLSSSINSSGNYCNFYLDVNTSTNIITARMKSMNSLSTVFSIALFGEGKSKSNYTTIVTQGSTSYSTSSSTTEYTRTISLPSTADFWQFIEAKAKIGTQERILYWIVSYAGNSSIGNRTNVSREEEI